MERIQNYINGTFQDSLSGNWIDNYDPSRGEVYSQIPDSSLEDVDMAVEAAQAVFAKWSSIGIEQRYQYLQNIALYIEKELEAFAAAESKDNGKPISLARMVDIPRAAANFRFFATAILHYASESHSMEGSAINYTLRQPIGVVGCISPWNLPLYLFTWKIAPALAAGNCVVAKPSELTPMTAFLLAKACQKVGLPDGVLNIVHGRGTGVGQAIVAHPAIKAISFTGGTSTGRHIASVAAPMFKKMSLELGGKNPNIIFEDADLAEAIQTAVRASFSNNGQICLCGSRIYVQRSVYEHVKSQLVEKVQKHVVGDPAHPSTQQGALVSKEHLEKVLSYIDLAKAEGGTVLTGGLQLHLQAPLEKGYYLAPTIIEGLPNSCRTNQEEIFGPVVTLQPFDTEEEVLTMANDTPYGLAAQLWTSDVSRATRMAERLQFGIVWVNCWMLRDLRTPFGGVKQSGVGREGGWEALRFFTEPKNVCIKY